jgi:hypothetical protein
MVETGARDKAGWRTRGVPYRTSRCSVSPYSLPLLLLLLLLRRRAWKYSRPTVFKSKPVQTEGAA